jgi:diketogulonate reductase-like aldo/keto reductase
MSENVTDTTGAAAAAKVPSVVLSSGYSIPQVGLGVLRVAQDETQAVVEQAIEVGYRHIDAAAGYDNEQGVGDALRALGFTGAESAGNGSDAVRSQIFVTTKLRDTEQGYDSALRAFDRQLKLLQLDYVDMYMIHWPTPFDWRSDRVWEAFMKLRSEGRVRTLGVCNFLPEHLGRLFDEVGEYPAVNQVELHPTWQQRGVVDYCKAHGIAVEAYSPMARGADLTAGEPVLQPIAEAHHITVAQVILRWHIQNGTIIIPKSVHRDRQQENLDLFGFSLSDAEMQVVTGLDSDTRAGHDPLTFSYS